MAQMCHTGMGASAHDRPPKNGSIRPYKMGGLDDAQSCESNYIATSTIIAGVSTYFRAVRGERQVLQIQPSTEIARSAQTTMERRSKLRIYEPFPVAIRGVDACGVPFRAHTVVDNLSAGGLYMRLVKSLEPGAELALTIRFSTKRRAEKRDLRVKARGVVVRSEVRSGKYGVGVRFTEHHFL